MKNQTVNLKTKQDENGFKLKSTKCKPEGIVENLKHKIVNLRKESFELKRNIENLKKYCKFEPSNKTKLET